MDAKTLIITIKDQLKNRGFKMTNENEAFIETLIDSIITHIKSQAIVKVTTTGNATTQSGIGEII